MDEKTEFSLTYKTYWNEIEKLFQVHRKGWINVLRLNPEKEYESVLINKRGLKGEQSSGDTKILVLSKYHIYKNDIIQWDPEGTIEEYWKIKAIEDYKPFLHCLVVQFNMSESDINALLREHGFNDAAEYFSKAKRLIQEGKPVDFSDCKNNCRKSIDSLLTALSGEEDREEAIKGIFKKGILGKREKELLISFDKFTAKLLHFLAKKGSHPPMPEKEEAILAVEVTEAFLKYLVSKTIA